MERLKEQGKNTEGIQKLGLPEAATTPGLWKQNRKEVIEQRSWKYVPEDRMIRCLREGSRAAGVKISERGHLTAGANEITRWCFGGL